MLMHNTTLGIWHELDSVKAGAEATAIILSTLGFMTLGVSYEWESGLGGGGGEETTLVIFSNKRAQK